MLLGCSKNLLIILFRCIVQVVKSARWRTRMYRGRLCRVRSRRYWAKSSKSRRNEKLKSRTKTLPLWTRLDHSVFWLNLLKLRLCICCWSTSVEQQKSYEKIYILKQKKYLSKPWREMCADMPKCCHIVKGFGNDSECNDRLKVNTKGCVIKRKNSYTIYDIYIETSEKYFDFLL